MTISTEKLKKIAAEIAREKPTLHFFGLVHRVDAPDRWDLLVSSDKLAPWSMPALKYIAERLQKLLTANEIVQIARVVALPPDNDVILQLLESPQDRRGDVSFLRPAERFDRALRIWPALDRLAVATKAPGKRQSDWDLLV
jgi:hypothetical protein